MSVVSDDGRMFDRLNGSFIDERVRSSVVITVDLKIHGGRGNDASFNVSPTWMDVMNEGSDATVNKSRDVIVPS